ncbi:MAG TPA: deoxyribodipyrimidine photo-lyase [Gammaproteobacteria bacterium]|nr:deoxyribodipyrimidine photo-lyase [Gammaproteobacteria bacterium]
MLKKYPLALHIFRRDLRLYDNSALLEALKLSECVLPCFIFDKRQIENNAYKSDHSLQFMACSLQELDAELRKRHSKLYLFYGIAEEVVAQLFQQRNIKAVFINRDYTPFSRKRDQKIADLCRNFNIDFHAYADALLHEPEEIAKSDHQPYTVFSHFLKKALQLPVQAPKNNSAENYYQKPIRLENRQALKKLLQLKNPKIFVKGGRIEALSLLKKVKNLEQYQEIRNFPAVQGTTRLSAHNKFGTLSIREFYAAIVKNFNENHILIHELHWRDFFTHIAFHYPRVFGKAFHGQYQGIQWNQNEKQFRAWCQGATGFPIVDAGMRELNATGFMHNRVRMIVASFLTKDLHIDWRKGEKYFSQQLVDYDPAVNNGNWQWAASTGCDAQPYFRIFNPWLQQLKFDPDCLYIKHWVPELAGLSPKTIHGLNKTSTTNYPPPMVNHLLESQRAKVMYKKARGCLQLK